MSSLADPTFPAPIEKPSAAQAATRAVSVAGLCELTSIVGLVALADLTIYRGGGFAGLGLLAVAVPALLLLGSPQRRLRTSFWVVGAMLVLLAARLVWQGSGLAVASGAVLLVAFSLALGGMRPYVLDLVAGFAQLPFAGAFGLAEYQRAATGFNPRISRPLVLSTALPAGAVAVFGTLFVLANPDLVDMVSRYADRWLAWLSEWVRGMSQNWREIGFWLVTAYLAIGLLRPLIKRSLTDPVASWVGSARGPYAASRGATETQIVEPPSEAPLYVPIRNMLWAVIGLFAAYLVFEFQTLWFREFPQGFYYAGYAHEGAAWLTAALALATLVLSLIFRGHVLADPRLGRLNWLAWVWSALNLLLAVTVYHRMVIYIDFNGMTRMRTIGLFGITTVVVGFALVLWKIVRHESFLWLIQRQLWTLAIAVYLFALTPVDTLVHDYNVRRILAGDLAPSVQISVHPISAEGYLVLLPLVDCPDQKICDGVRAMLAERQLVSDRVTLERTRLGWTRWQMSEELLHKTLHWSGYRWDDLLANDAARESALDSFRTYAYQWY